MEVNTVDKQPLTLSEVEEQLKTIEKKGELSGGQQRTKDFATKFNKVNKSSATKLVKELDAAKIPRLTKETITEIVNLMPQNESELKTVFAGNKTTVTKENIEKILSILKA
tara:strand:- start:1483 stop:1815 length:333 start_codon:yes stop_codon:yes gene_type:complete